MSSLSRTQESEIFPLLDRTLSLPHGKALVYECSPSRANYLERMITGLKYENAIESIQMYSPGDPLYGQGNYANIWAEQHLRGLVVAHLDAPRDTLPWRLIQCAAHKQTVPLQNTHGTARSRLDRFRKRHPDVMGHLWIDPGPPIAVRYGEPSVEELVVVDIDVDPILKAPTDEQLAKLKQYR